MLIKAPLYQFFYACINYYSFLMWYTAHIWNQNLVNISQATLNKTNHAN